MNEFKTSKAIVAMLLVTMMVGCVAVTAVSADWVTFQHNNDRNGNVGNSPAGPTTTPHTVWDAFTDCDQYQTSGIDVSPIIGGNYVYVIDFNGTVSAFDRIDGDGGTPAWTNTQWHGSSSFQLSTPVYNNGVLYVAFTRAVWANISGTWTLVMQHPIVAAINANTGATLWYYDQILENVEITTPLTLDTSTGYLYFGTWDYYGVIASKYWCINTATHAFVWNKTTPGGIYNAGAGMLTDDYLLVGDDIGNVTSYNKMTGDIRDSINIDQIDPSAVGYSIRSSIVRYSGTELYFTACKIDYNTYTYDGYCFKLRYHNTYGDEGKFYVDDSCWASPIGYSTSTPAVYNDRVYVGGGTYDTYAGNEDLYCLDATNGDQIWSYYSVNGERPNGGVQSSPVIYTKYTSPNAGTYIYFTTNTGDGKVYCVDDTGTEKWAYDQPAGHQGYILQGVALTEGYLYFGNDAGYLICIHS